MTYGQRPGQKTPEQRQQEALKYAFEKDIAAIVHVRDQPPQTIRPYYRHQISEEGVLMVWCVVPWDGDGEEQYVEHPALTVAPGDWHTVYIPPLQGEESRDHRVGP